jgi:hypothetical protein
VSNKGKVENLKHFEPGHPGGPGRPPGMRNLKTVIREALEAEAPAEYVEKLKAQGVLVKDNSWDSVLAAVAMAKAASGSILHLREIWDRRDGKAKQTIDAKIELPDLESAKQEIKDAVKKYGLFNRT